MAEHFDLTDFQAYTLTSVLREIEVRRKANTTNIHPYRRQAKASKLWNKSTRVQLNELQELVDHGLITIKRDNLFTMVFLTKEGIEFARAYRAFQKF